jgi:serine phosphatase RsbU (regulator of sigma subunit)
MATNMARNNPLIMAALEKNCFEHISLMAQEQVEVEFRNEMQQIMMMKQNPQAMQDPNMQNQLRMMAEKIEARKAQLVADMMGEFMREEKKITSQFDNDPIAKLRSRELDLQAQENARKRQEGEDRINLDKMRAMMNQENQDEKLEQNEELAKLRANTSIEKTILSKTLPSAKDMGAGSVIIKKTDD